MGAKFWLVVRYALAVLAVLLVIGLQVDSVQVMPRNAWVYVNRNAMTYLAPACAPRGTAMVMIQAEEAYELDLKPDEKCRDEGGFTAEGRSLTGELFERIGLLRPLPPRWNSDGTWNW